MKKIATILLVCICMITHAQTPLPALKISANKRFFQTQDGKPFFWLGDTGWLLFVKCNKEEAVQYLETRKQQGFNVVQVMVLHQLATVNVYGDSALINRDIATPKNLYDEPIPGSFEYGFWNHVDFIVSAAEKMGIYMAMVPVWGSNVKDGKITVKQAEAYAKFLANRYKNKSNIIWLNGGDIKGSDEVEVWKTIGANLKKYDPAHLVTFHPRGRNSSSEWFQEESWMDFNMFQSGHRTYAQDTSSNEKNHFGEDNWRYINADYHQTPFKPVLDGEPSYENIPHGLYDGLQPRWTAADVRRYAYWSVFAGGAGFTYGENSVMQFHTNGDKNGSFGVNKNWKETINAPGASQMKYLKELLLSRSYFDRVPAQEIIVDNTRDKYNYLLATKARNYAMVYTYTGRNFSVDLSKLGFKISGSSWFSPAYGTKTEVIKMESAKGIVQFDPPGEPRDGNDWVLILE
jgi:hypothetical protein